MSDDWIVADCSEPGCGVRIRYHIGAAGVQDPLCRWHQSGLACYARRSSVPPPDTESDQQLYSKDEFGVNLYDAIQTASSIAYCREKYPDRVPDLEMKLMNLLPELDNPADVRRILEMIAPKEPHAAEI